MLQDVCIIIYFKTVFSDHCIINMPPFPSSSRLDETSEVTPNRDVPRNETSNSRNCSIYIK